MTGNFGAGRRKGGSSLNDIPANQRETLGNFPTQDEYYNRLIEAYNTTDDLRLRTFIEGELRKMDAQRPGSRVESPPQGAFCCIDDHFVGSHQ